ncbi:MAG: response regulator [Gemmatimonadota bacterium]|nr:response regulator [Gemmatimonadota bacterium]
MPLPRVLIIDDEPSIRFALRRWFERQGWSADEATDGAKALEFLRSPAAAFNGDYAVIVCDLRMPGMSGSQFHAVLTDEYPALIEKLVVTTGDDVASPPIGSVLGTHRRVLQKPFEFDVLRSLVESIVGPM